VGRRIAAVVLALAVGACGGHSLTEPDSVVVAPGQVAQAALPPHIFGSFAASADVPEIGPQGGNVVLVVPSYSDDPERVAAALQANGKVAIVSAHHVFGGPRETWGVDPSPGAQALAAPRAYQIHGATAVSVGGWLQTQDWMKPLEARGLVAAVYVVDEPLHNGIAAARRDEAIAIVRAAGYRTVVGEWVDEASRNGRAPSDLYGATCYDWPGFGSWTLERCREAYRTHPGWNLAIGQAFDLHARSGTADQQLSAWAVIGRERDGVVFWVARWPGQTGILDNPELLAAYRKAAAR